MTQNANPTDYIYVPLPVELYAELIRRSGQSNVSSYIEHFISSTLDSTEGDPNIWSDKYVEKYDEGEAEFYERYGDPRRGYQWQNLFLPNGTQLRMTYRGESSHGEVRNEKVFLKNVAVSPSEFASKIANNTSRNAWRDIYVQFPNSTNWVLAHDLRQRIVNGGSQ